MDISKSNGPASNFSADRPITTRNQDLLGRAPFAEALAAALRGWRGRDSLVVALYGPWGCGKSSVKNLVCEALAQGDEPPLIVNFNPWEWSAQKGIMEAFFQQVGLLLGRDGETKYQEAAKRWRLYEKGLRLGGGVLDTLARAVGLAYGLPPTEVIVAAGALNEAGKVVGVGAEALEAMENSQGSNLAELKSELAASLAALNQPILVIMDDIDRLSRDEVRLIFQLVKANADLPGLVFLLLFQRDLVERSLEELAPDSGAEFLEKIVQVGFDVPQVDAARLHRALFQGIERILGSDPNPTKREQVRFGNLFHGGMSGYFKNLRDVYRFLSTLEFHALAHRRETVLNVNPVDLIGLECIRVFEPAVFRQLPNMKTTLTDLGRRGDAEAKRASIDRLLGLASEVRREGLREILKCLSQPVAWVFEGYTYGEGFEGEWNRSLRLSASAMFDRYFTLTLGDEEVTEAEVQHVLATIHDREALVTLFQDLNRRGKLASLLVRLEAHKGEFDLAHAVPLVTALFDISDEFSFPDSSFGFGPDWSALRIVHWYLMRYADRSKRGEILKSAARASSGIYLPVFKTSIELGKRERQTNPDRMAVSEEDADLLRQICVEKIRRAARSGTLVEHPKLAAILYRWREWAADLESKAWVESLVSTPTGALRFLAGVMVKVTSQSEGDHVSSSAWRIDLRNVETFVASQNLVSQLEGIDEEQLYGRESAALGAFRRAIERREQGKGDPGPLDADDLDDE